MADSDNVEIRLLLLLFRQKKNPISQHNSTTDN